jgi:hypothetical protein
MAKKKEDLSKYKTKPPKRTFICGTEDKTIDSLRWYIAENERGHLSIDGMQFGQCAMSMSLDCARNPRDYMPSKIRAKALELLEARP